MATIRFLLLTLVMVPIAIIVNSMDYTAKANNTDSALKPGVDHDFAKARAANLSDVRYSLDLEVMPGASKLIGSEQIHVKLKDASSDLVIDWRVAKRDGQPQRVIKNVVINDRPVSNFREIEEHIVIPSANLQIG